MFLWFEQVIQQDPDHIWSVLFDSASDLCGWPVIIVMIANPRPLIVNVIDKKGKSKFGAKEWYEAMSGEVMEIRKIDDKFYDVVWVTDNEPTMKLVRSERLTERGYSIGCFSHGLNKSIGTHILYILSFQKVILKMFFNITTN